MLQRFWLLTLVLFIQACNKEADYLYHRDPPDLKRSVRSYPIKEIANDTNVDILWVIDNSGSMMGIQQNVIRNSEIFMQSFLKHKHLQWKMGLISTDENEAPYLGFSKPFDHLTAASGRDVVQEFRDAVSKLGTNGSATEQTFYNINRVIDSYPQFLRSRSHLAVIMVTDEKEQSEEEHGAQWAAPAFLNMLKAKVSDEHKIRFYGALEMKDFIDCPNAYSDSIYAGSPYENIINNTGGFVLSACVDFGDKLAAIGDDIVSLIKLPEIMLKERPKLETIRVIYKGVELPNGTREEGGYWYYDEYFNTINFYSLDFAPDFDSESITIEFDIDDGIVRGSEEDESNLTHGDRVRQNILAKAMEHFILNGVAAVTFQSLAHALKMSKSNVLYHYPSKEALVLACLQDLLARHQSLFANTDFKIHDAKAQLKGFLHANALWCIHYPQDARFLHAAIIAGQWDSDLHLLVVEIFQTMESKVDRLLKTYYLNAKIGQKTMHQVQALFIEKIWGQFLMLLYNPHYDNDLKKIEANIDLFLEKNL